MIVNFPRNCHGDSEGKGIGSAYQLTRTLYDDFLRMAF